MAIKVYKVAEIVQRRVMPCYNRKNFRPGDLAAILTNLEPVESTGLEGDWKLDIEIGVGQAMRRILVDLPPLISRFDSLDNPVFIGEDKLVYFRDRLFMPERIPMTSLEREEIILRVKKAVYVEQSEIAGLRSVVANFEAAIEYKKSGSKRDPIPEDVKLVVWARDGGACVRCGLKKDLHFDHIIPLSKGGGNSEANVQILCQSCNLKKSDKIASS